MDLKHFLTNRSFAVFLPVSDISTSSQASNMHFFESPIHTLAPMVSLAQSQRQGNYALQATVNNWNHLNEYTNVQLGKLMGTPR